MPREIRCRTRRSFRAFGVGATADVSGWELLTTRTATGNWSHPTSQTLALNVPESGLLSTAVLDQSRQRLRVLALLYAFVFAMAGFVPGLLFPSDRARLLASVQHWLPGVLSISLALVVAVLASASRVTSRTVVALAPAFAIASSYGIAFAEFFGSGRLGAVGFMGLSWVALWIPLFFVVVPTRPSRAAFVSLAAVTAVPVAIILGDAVHARMALQEPIRFFLWHILAYLLIVLISYLGAYVMDTLGSEVSRARELGSYRLIDRLGYGGMGEVWRAEHRLLARPAAIKLVRPIAPGHFPSPDDGAMRRFEREAQITAQLRSPHTVDLYDFGVADDGSFYYVMELLDGFDLDTLVRRFGPVPAARAIAFLRQICHSLNEAESYGLVHRDMKPANIFVCRYGADDDFIKVLDFGIAKGTSGMLDTIAMTRDELFRGTPAFIAPEQVIGDKVDGRADLYAVGCVAYWLLTGELVFTGHNAMKVMLDHAHTAPLPPSARSEQPIPPELDRIVLDCLAKNPDDRPQTAKELASRLSAVPGADHWTEGLARQWWNMHHAETRVSKAEGHSNLSSVIGKSVTRVPVA